MSLRSDMVELDRRMARVRKAGAILAQKLLDTWIAKHLPKPPPLEQQAMSKNFQFSVGIVEPGRPNAGEVTLVLDGTTLDPNTYNDWLIGGSYLKRVDRDSLHTWVTWSRQGGRSHSPELIRRWDGFVTLDVATDKPEIPMTITVAPLRDERPGYVTIEVGGQVMDPRKYYDWVRVGVLMKVEHPDCFELWMRWSHQAKDQNPMSRERLLGRWNSFHTKKYDGDMLHETADQLGACLAAGVSVDWMKADSVILGTGVYAELPNDASFKPEQGPPTVKPIKIITESAPCQPVSAPSPEGTWLLEKGERVATPAEWGRAKDIDQAMGYSEQRLALATGTQVHADLELVMSTKNTIAEILDRYTDISGNAVTITDLSAMQQELNDVICPEVLKARELTVLDLVALGMLSEIDLANHMADVCAAITGKPVNGKAAMKLIVELRREAQDD